MQMKSHLRKLFSPAEQAFYDLVECEVERAGEGEGVGSAPPSPSPAPQHTLICTVCLILSQVCWNFSQSRKRRNSFPFLGGFVFI